MPNISIDVCVAKKVLSSFTRQLWVWMIVFMVAMAGCGWLESGDDELRIVALDPKNETEDVVVTTTISATFNKSIDPSTINTNSFKLVTNGGIAVAGSVAYNDSNRTATFTPTVPLQNWVTYTATITTDVTKANNSDTTLSSDFSWQFTMISRPILYHSKRALDGSDWWNAAGSNIWKVELETKASEWITNTTAIEDAHSVNPRWSPNGNYILFISRMPVDGSDTANDSYNIWLIGSGLKNERYLTNVTAEGVSHTNAEWSPDGSHIIFDSNRALDGSNAMNTNGVRNIWVIENDGTNLTALTESTINGALSVSPTYSPDGSKILFHSKMPLDDEETANSPTNIWVMDSDGENATALTNSAIGGMYSMRPRWSPDGSRIVFQSRLPLGDETTANDCFNILIMDADGGNLTAITTLTAEGADSENPQWSSDGLNIVCQSNRSLDGTDAANVNGFENIWVVDVSGSSATPLTNLTVVDAFSRYPWWSPDGSKILYVSTRAFDASLDQTNSHATCNVWVMDTDGSNATPLTSLDGGGPSRFAIW